MNINKQVEAKQKVLAVIESCRNHKHMETAKNMVDNYLKETEDVLGHQELAHTYNIKMWHDINPEY